MAEKFVIVFTVALACDAQHLALNAERYSKTPTARADHDARLSAFGQEQQILSTATGGSWTRRAHQAAEGLSTILGLTWELAAVATYDFATVRRKGGILVRGKVDAETLGRHFLHLMKGTDLEARVFEIHFDKGAREDVKLEAFLVEPPDALAIIASTFPALTTSSFTAAPNALTRRRPTPARRRRIPCLPSR